MREIYLDNSATTKPYPKVAEKVMHALTEVYGNPSSLHRLGQESKAEVQIARQHIANALGADQEEIYFTSGARNRTISRYSGFVRQIPIVVTVL